jgi:DNA (cytosine-5)-methyltransferase 1
MASVKTLINRSQDTGLRFISLYCGAGGLDLGFYRAGFNPVQSIDINKEAIKTYKSVFSEHEVLCGDASKLRPKKAVDLVIGGPPCQGFSVAGYANPDDPRSKHIMTFMKTVKAVKPKVFVMENVKALAVSGKWEANRKRLLRLASQLGYDGKFFVLDASLYGVPQRRERMFFVGVRGKNNLELDPPKNSRTKSIRSVLEELPAYGKVGNHTICTAKIVVAKRPVVRGSPYSGMFFNGKGRILNLEQPALTLPASMGGNHTPIIDQRCLVEGSRNWAEGFFAKLEDGSKVKRVPKFLRRLTVEEAAALQTFPAGMKFSGTNTAKYRQIGNAVPPQLAYMVAKRIRDQIF